jgi:hypothetical protein
MDGNQIAGVQMSKSQIPKLGKSGVPEAVDEFDL